MPPDAITVDAIALLKALVAIPSLSGQEGACADFLQEKLAGWFPGVVRRDGHNLIVTLDSDRPGPTLLLCSHIDTVAVAPGWTRDPFGAVVEQGRIYGLGANDAGASVVSMIAAARATPLQAGKLVLCLAAEEEAGSNGFMKAEPALPRYDAAIFGEPTDMGMATAMRGAMRAILRSRGAAAHASRPWEGRNATDRLVQDIGALRALPLKDTSPWGQATIEPTILRGGESSNQLPALIETTLDIRTTPERDNDWMLAAFQKLDAEIDVTVNRRRPMFNPPDSPLVKAIGCACHAVKNYNFNGTCDMAFSKAPSVVMGPGHSTRSHVADEYIEIAEIAAAVPMYGAIIAAYLNGHA